MIVIGDVWTENEGVVVLVGVQVVGGRRRCDEMGHT